LQAARIVRSHTRNAQRLAGLFGRGIGEDLLQALARFVECTRLNLELRERGQRTKIRRLKHAQFSQQTDRGRRLAPLQLKVRGPLQRVSLPRELRRNPLPCDRCSIRIELLFLQLRELLPMLQTRLRQNAQQLLLQPDRGIQLSKLLRLAHQLWQSLRLIRRRK
jgi:hypothetical protein